MTQKTDKEPLGIRIFRGVELSLLGQAVVFVAALAVTPILVERLGVDGYALYTLIWTMLSYLSLADMGTSLGTQRFTALLTGKDQPERLAAILRKSLIFQLAIALLGGGIGYALHGWIAADLLDMDARLVPTAGKVFACVFATAPFFFFSRFAIAILFGQARFAEYNILHSLQTVSVAVSAALLAYFGHGLAEIAVAFIVLQALLAAAGLWLVRGALVPRETLKDPGDMREYFAFSFKGFLSQALWVLTFQGDRIFIGRLLPLEQMAFYVVGSGIAQKLNVLCASVAATVSPIFTELHGKGDEVRLRRIYLKTTQLNLYILVPITIMTFLLAPQFLTLWLGQEFSLAGTHPLRLLVLANIAYVGTLLPNNIALGKGFPQWQGYMQAGKAVILVALWTILIPRFGILGAAGGLMVSEWLGTPLFVGVVHRKLLALGWGEYIVEGCWRPLAAGLVLGLLGVATHGYVGSWLSLIAYGAFGCSAYLAAGFLLLDSDAKKLLRDWVGKRL